jgi:hypothetical protein
MENVLVPQDGQVTIATLNNVRMNASEMAYA